MQLLGPLVTTRQAGGYLDLEGGNRICMVLKWTRPRPCESCACIIHTNRAACPFLVQHSTIITSEESLRDSKLPVTGCLRTKGQESVYETCACVIHTILLN